MKGAGLPYLLASYSALDSFFKLKEPGYTYVNTTATLINLARIFDNLLYPGLPLEDAAIMQGEQKFIFRCVDELETGNSTPFTAMQLLYDTDRDVFLDSGGIYPELRQEELHKASQGYPYELELMEAAKLVSRYHYKPLAYLREKRKFNYDISPEEQREFLASLLLARHSHKGLQLLSQAGFLEKVWPEIHSMVNVKQTKDYHPEGDVWQHTLETLKYRKRIDLTLSLALLFHDIGKPVANGPMEKPFDGHSELGVKIATRFLRRLHFPEALVKDVCFLVRYHMLPFALPRLPLYRSEKVMNSPLFPLLLEVYRADSSSSFIGPEGYYQACRFYRSYLRDKKNPFKSINFRTRRAQ